jgi:hypothetical protein
MLSILPATANPKIKTFKDALMSWLQATLPKTGGEIIHAAYIKKALAESLAFLKPKRPGFSSLDWFLYCGEDARRSATHPIRQILPQQTFFLFQREKLELAGL